MTGPALVGIRNVDNPYDNLQKAVGEAGSIYKDYQKASMDAEQHNAQMAEIDRVNQQRDFLQNYDPQLGVDGRGLTDEAKRFASEEMDKIIKSREDAFNKGEKVETPEELAKKLAAAQRSLVTQEAAKDVIINDLTRFGGLTAAQAEAEATARIGSFGTRAGIQASEEARAAEINKAIEARRTAAKATGELLVNTVKANNTGLGTGSRAGGGSGSNSTNPYARTGSIKDVEELNTFVENNIGSWDIEGATPIMAAGYAEANERLINAGLRPIPFDEFGMYVNSSIVPAWTGKDIRQQSPGQMALELEKKYSTLGYQQAFARKEADDRAAGARSTFKAPQWIIDNINDPTHVTPRAMTEVEKERVQRAFGTYTPPSKAPATPKRPAAPTNSSLGVTNTNDQKPTKEQLAERDALLARAAEHQKAIEERNKIPTSDKKVPPTIPRPTTEQEKEAKGVADTLFSIDQELIGLDLRKRIVNVPDNVTDPRQRSNIIAQERVKTSKQIQDLQKQRADILKALETPGMRDARKLVDDSYEEIIQRNKQAAEDERQAAKATRQATKQAAKDRATLEKNIQEIEKTLNNPNLPPVLRSRLESNLKELRN